MKTIKPMLKNIQSTFQIDVFSFELYTLFDHINANQTNRQISETENVFFCCNKLLGELTF